MIDLYTDMEKVPLDDDCYAQFDGYHIIVTVGDRAFYLNQQTVDALSDYIARVDRGVVWHELKCLARRLFK
jgi:hypothetical protein